MVAGNVYLSGCDGWGARKSQTYTEDKPSDTTSCCRSIATSGTLGQDPQVPIPGTGINPTTDLVCVSITSIPWFVRSAKYIVRVTGLNPITSTFALPGVPVAFHPGTGMVCKYTSPDFCRLCPHTAAGKKTRKLQQTNSRSILIRCMIHPPYIVGTSHRDNSVGLGQQVDRIQKPIALCVNDENARAYRRL